VKPKRFLKWSAVTVALALALEVVSRAVDSSLFWRVYSLQVLLPGSCRPAFSVAAHEMELLALPPSEFAPNSSTSDWRVLRAFGVSAKEVGPNECTFVFRFPNRLSAVRLDGGPMRIGVSKTSGKVTFVGPAAPTLLGI
jgi:hypothetical protein